MNFLLFALLVLRSLLGLDELLNSDYILNFGIHDIKNIKLDLRELNLLEMYGILYCTIVRTTYI